MLTQEEANALIEALTWHERDPGFRAYTPDTYARLIAIVRRETTKLDGEVELAAQKWRESVRQLILDFVKDGTLKAESAIFERVAILERQLRSLFHDVRWETRRDTLAEARKRIEETLR